MGGRIAVAYRDQSGNVSAGDGWTSGLCWFAFHADLGSKPEEVVPKYMETYLEDPVPFAPLGYGLVVIDALPLASGGRVQVHSWQAYMDLSDPWCFLPLNGSRSIKELQELLKELFARFPANLLTYDKMSKRVEVHTEDISFEDAKKLFRKTMAPPGEPLVILSFPKIEFPTRDVDFVDYAWTPAGIDEMRSALAKAGFDVSSEEWAHFRNSEADNQ